MAREAGEADDLALVGDERGVVALALGPGADADRRAATRGVGGSVRRALAALGGDADPGRWRPWRSYAVMQLWRSLDG